MPTNVPVTIYRDTDGLAEYSNVGASYIVDPSDTFLVDPSDTYIVDTGVVQSRIPATVWEEDDSL
jgi:hypothetical protein